MRLACLFAFLLSVSLQVAAQSTEADLGTRLLHKDLYLRGQWHDSKLKFDAAGHLIGQSDPISFTLSGIDIQSVKLESKKLKIEGRRVGLKFVSKDGKDIIQRVTLMSPNLLSFEIANVELQVAKPDNGDFASALDAIFADDLSAFVPALPGYWTEWGTRHLLSDPPRAEEKPHPAPGTKVIGGVVEPPRPLFTPEPKFGAYARSTRLSGNVLVYLQVDTNGNPTNIRILRPLGLGLDEAAVDAVSKYRLKPASENGVPVRIEMNVDVNFTIF